MISVLWQMKKKSKDIMALEVPSNSMIVWYKMKTTTINPGALLDYFYMETSVGFLSTAALCLVICLPWFQAYYYLSSLKKVRSNYRFYKNRLCFEVQDDILLENWFYAVLAKRNLHI